MPNTRTRRLFHAASCAAAVIVIGAYWERVPTAQSSPTAAMKAYYDAARQKDLAALKNLLSEEYVKELSTSGLTFERVMASAIERVPPAMPSMRNERIAGERATLEVLDHETKRWETFAFVRQRGAWKLALQQTK
jgi:hypothetical protein